MFLTDLLDHPDFGPSTLDVSQASASAVRRCRRLVAERAEALGITVYRSYGSTEHPSITGSRTDEPAAKRCGTDGHPLDGVDLRLLDVDTGLEVGPGQPGEILSRGPDLFAGYSEPSLTRRAFLADGWYRTGDIGVLDDDGYLTITDRVSDIIIRGGSNISAAEIEEALIRMPVVAECAVVATPDTRLGERAVAVLRLRQDAPRPDLAQVQAHLHTAGIPKQKWVEAVQVVDDFPRTPSGKIRKFVLREELQRA